MTKKQIANRKQFVNISIFFSRFHFNKMYLVMQCNISSTILPQQIVMMWDHDDIFDDGNVFKTM